MNKRTVGSQYENMASHFLKENGIQVIEKNFRCRLGEIDLIGKDGEYYVFVEVKYRTSDAFGIPASAVTAKKQHTIRKCAQYYLIKNGLSEDIPCRFDVIGIMNGEIEHYVNAF